MIEKRTELTGSGRGRTVVVVVSDREACCDEPDYQEAELRGELNLLLWEEKRNVQMWMSWTRILVSEQSLGCRDKYTHYRQSNDGVSADGEDDES